MSANGGAHPRVCEPENPESVRHPAKNPRVRAPIRPPGSMGRGRFTQVEGVVAGSLKNCGILGAGTVGQGAKTMGSYTVALRGVGRSWGCKASEFLRRIDVPAIKSTGHLLR